MNLEDFDFHDNSFLDENDLSRLKKNKQAIESDELLKISELKENKKLKREASHRLLYFSLVDYWF
jgi:hypothetical protein